LSSPDLLLLLIPVFILTRYLFVFFFSNDPAPTEIYTLSLHDALPISDRGIGSCGTRNARPQSLRHRRRRSARATRRSARWRGDRSEEHTSELQSLTNLVCRLLLEKKKTIDTNNKNTVTYDQRNLTSTG